MIYTWWCYILWLLPTEQSTGLGAWVSWPTEQSTGPGACVGVQTFWETGNLPDWVFCCLGDKISAADSHMSQGLPSPQSDPQIACGSQNYWPPKMPAHQSTPHVFCSSPFPSFFSHLFSASYSSISQWALSPMQISNQGLIGEKQNSWETGVLALGG